MPPKVYKSPAITQSVDNDPTNSIINYEAIRAHTNEQYGPPRMIRGVVAQPESQPALVQELPDTMHQLSPETLELYRVSVKEAGTVVTSARLAQLANVNA